MVTNLPHKKLRQQKQNLSVNNNTTASQDYENAFAVASNLFGVTEVVNSFMEFMKWQTITIFSWIDGKKKYDSPAWENVRKLAEALLERKALKYKEVEDLIS